MNSIKLKIFVEKLDYFYDPLQETSCLYYKTFKNRNSFYPSISQSVCNCQSLPPQSNIWGKAWSLTSKWMVSSIYVIDSAWAGSCLARQLKVADTLAYFRRARITAVKSLRVNAVGLCPTVLISSFLFHSFLPFISPFSSSLFIL